MTSKSCFHLYLCEINNSLNNIMSKSKLEYIWLDGYYPTQNMRSKTKVENNFSGKLEDCPIWSFDGSSTKQASGGSSDCLLKPVAIYPDPARRDGFLVMTEVLMQMELLMYLMVEQPLKMKIMISGLVLSKSILLWIQRLNCL